MMVALAASIPRIFSTSMTWLDVVLWPITPVVRSCSAREEGEEGEKTKRTVGSHDLSKTLTFNEQVLQAVRVLLDNRTLETDDTLAVRESVSAKIGKRRGKETNLDDDTGEDATKPKHLAVRRHLVVRSVVRDDMDLGCLLLDRDVLFVVVVLSVSIPSKGGGREKTYASLDLESRSGRDGVRDALEGDLELEGLDRLHVDVYGNVHLALTVDAGDDGSDLGTRKRVSSASINW
jgi:hypothetical protein